MVEAICRKKTYITAPGIVPADFLPETIEQCICRIFEVKECELKGIGKCDGVIFAKHFYRALLIEKFGMKERPAAKRAGCSHVAVHGSKNAYHQIYETNKFFRSKVDKVLNKIEKGLIYDCN